MIEGSEFEGKWGTASPTSQEITTDDILLTDGKDKGRRIYHYDAAGNGNLCWQLSGTRGYYGKFGYGL